MMLQLHSTQGFLGTLAVLALMTTAIGFLLLVWRVCWAVQRFVATCLERVRMEEKIVDMFLDYIETQRLTNQQLWSASASLSSC